MNFRTRLNRFMLRNRNKGIPNLMLYIVIGNAIVSLMSMLNGGSFLMQLLLFDKQLILQGQVWRLFSFVFTQYSSGILGLLFLFFFYMLGRQVEMQMGTLRFNLYYLTGIILMDIFAMCFYPTDISTAEAYTAALSVVPYYWNMSYYLHLTLVLTYATMNPNAQFLVLFVIPVKAKWLAILDLFLVFTEVFNLSYPVLYFPHNLFPLVALGSYLIFMWSELPNLLPISWQLKGKAAKKKTGSIPFRPKETAEKPNYTHKCSICGRTNVTDPQLEFRYCSRCSGYHCYCIDHINNHEHIN